MFVDKYLSINNKCQLLRPCMGGGLSLPRGSHLCSQSRGFSIAAMSQNRVMVKSSATVPAHFAKAGANVKATYDALIKAARVLGPVREEPKKTSIHLVRKSAFAGIATRKDSLILTLKASAALPSPRVERSQQASAHRWHHEVRLRTPSDVDRELRTWLERAYELAE
jgi:hypothetical protein